MIREAASVILLRPASSGFEVLLLRRRKGASFMPSAFVFPGGGAEPGEDARSTAARELFEEAGVLLAHDAGEAETLEAPSLATMRKRILAGESATSNLTAAGLAWSTESLTAWSHWITPSIEPRRFSARFFIAELPPGQVPSFDDIETVDEAWVTPRDALARASLDDLALPPPQVRTFWELAHCASIAAVRAAAKIRENEPHPIMPRLGGNALLLPWDPEYGTVGTGEGTPLTYHPSWAHGPSRFVMEDKAWRHVAPNSPTAG